MDIERYIAGRFGVRRKSQQRLYSVKNYGRADLATLLNEIGAMVGVEIGTEGGKFASVLCKNIPNLKLYCVDPYCEVSDFQGYKRTSRRRFEKYYSDARKRVEGQNVIFITELSSQAINRFDDNSLDFVYIDGNHRLDYVVWDIVNWTDKVKPGGIVAGHDYIKLKDQKYMHIPYALEAYFQSYRRSSNLFVLDNKNKMLRSEEENKRFDRIKSWFFVK